MKELIDPHGRRIRKLRVSLTDKCNLRCHYCMPIDQQFMDETQYLHIDEYVQLIQELVVLGLEEVRLTGGEPLMRKSFPQILEKISNLGLKKISLTTNGIYLDKYFQLLKEHGVQSINLSLDSLNAENFRRITFGNYLEKILKNIHIAQSLGFVIKINTVMMKGINDHEVLDFIHFSQIRNIQVRFLELMRIGLACKDQVNQFISAQELISKIKLSMDLKPVTSALDSTSVNFLTSTGAQIGFIASESQAFCGQCSRWRLSSDGILRACLLKEDGVSIKGLNSFERQKVYQRLLGMKPLLRPYEVAHQMNAIGG